ncbi:MAG: hypothetical protein ABH869_00580 [Candidatus Omnitrophota bacterium]
MVLFTKLISITIMVYGCLLALRPTIMRKIVDYVKQKKRVYAASGIKACIGIVLMFAASYCTISWIVFFLGAVSVLSGILVFLIKKSAVTKIIEWWEKKPLKSYRMAGIFALILGVLLTLAV